MDKEDVFSIVLVVIAFALICAVVFGISYGIEKNTCEAQTQNIGFSSKFGFWSGCMIEIEPEIWIPLDNYRFFGDE